MAENSALNHSSNSAQNNSSQGNVECPFCGKIYMTFGSMKRHINEFHLKNVKFNCDLCCCKFKRKYYLKKHMMEKHKKGMHL